MTAVQERRAAGRSGDRADDKSAKGFVERVSAARTALTAWLSRPLASFHLVLALFCLLLAIGLVMVLSATSVESYSAGESVYGLFKKQALFACLGLVGFWVALRIPLRELRRFSGPLVVASVFLLVAVLVIGKRVNGSKGWFVLGPIQFQPVELAKLALTLWGAHMLVRRQTVNNQYRHLLVPLVPMALVMFGLVLLEPDLTSGITLGVVMIALLWFVGAPLRVFGAVAAGGSFGILLLAIGAKYRLARVLSFLRPGSDPSGAAYQADQALYALADGGLFGRGLGQGTAKWHYLPELHTDFIFALIGEELGFVGAALVLALFALLAVIGLRIAARNVDPWIRLVSGTLTVWLVSQAAINIGYVVGILPVTGIPLPMISYGGTSLVTTMCVFGILANCARHEPEAVAALRAQGPGRFGRLLHLPAPPVYRRPTGRRKPVRKANPPHSTARGSSAPYGQDRRRASRATPAVGERGRGGQDRYPRVGTSRGRTVPGRPRSGR